MLILPAYQDVEKVGGAIACHRPLVREAVAVMWHALSCSNRATWRFLPGILTFYPIVRLWGECRRFPSSQEPKSLHTLSSAHAPDSSSSSSIKYQISSRSIMYPIFSGFEHWARGGTKARERFLVHLQNTTREPARVKDKHFRYRLIRQTREFQDL